MKTHKHIKSFNELNESLSKIDLSEKNMIKNIIKTQGKDIDQRLIDERKIYTEDKLSSMEYEEILKIYNKIFHPRCRTW